MEMESQGRDMPAGIQCARMDWDYQAYNPKDFDIIWAPPPCAEYSIAKTTGARKLETNKTEITKEP